MTSKEFTKAVSALDTIDYNKIDKSFAILNEDINVEDINPKDITLNRVITISQEDTNGELKKFLFDVAEVWLKPTHMWTVVSSQKEKTPENLWILFYDNGNYFLKKGLKSPVGVHVSF
jgi:hypothetical protein